MVIATSLKNIIAQRLKKVKTKNINYYSIFILYRYVIFYIYILWYYIIKPASNIKEITISIIVKDLVIEIKRNIESFKWVY